MSRYVEPDFEDNWEFRAGVWEINAKRAFRGKRGQAVLREIEAALLALPEPKLYDGKFCETVWDPETDTEQVQACVLGAWAYRKKDFDTIQYLNGEDGERPDINETAQQLSSAHRRKGMTFTMAWELIYSNDERHYRCTPEVRWMNMLSEVRSHLPEIKEIIAKIVNMGVEPPQVWHTLNQIRREQLLVRT